MLEEHMANLEGGLVTSEDLDRIFVVSLGPTDKDVLATRVEEAMEARRYVREERGPVTDHAKETVWSRGWSA